METNFSIKGFDKITKGNQTLSIHWFLYRDLQYWLFLLSMDCNVCAIRSTYRVVCVINSTNLVSGAVVKFILWKPM